MPASTIYYIRHGETDWNVEGRLQGGIDTPLNDLGRSQARHAGRVLADLFARQGLQASNLAFVASPLQRARVTMDIVRAELKFLVFRGQPDRHIAVTHLPHHPIHSVAEKLLEVLCLLEIFAERFLRANDVELLGKLAIGVDQIVAQ